MDTFSIIYGFNFNDGHEAEFSLAINARTLDLCCDKSRPLPEWTALEFNQCPNCPLETKSNPHCPVAVNLVSLVEDCGKLDSYEDVLLEVITPQRNISAKTTVQRGVSSLLGLIMATSACPHTAFFRPMARFHLPLATDEETIYRAVSTYLLEQYFRYKKGGNPDYDLKGLADIYHNIQIINKAMAKRLREASERDAAVNAVILLDLLAKTLPYSIEDSLGDIQYLFSANYSG